MSFIELWLIAGLILGEAGPCEPAAQIAVVHVWRNRHELGWQGGWYGWQRPKLDTVWLAQRSLAMPDRTGGGLFLWSDQDLQYVEVQKIISDLRLHETRAYACGLHVYSPPHHHKEAE